MVYVQDFPLKADTARRAKVDPGLGQDIVRFLKHLSVPDTVSEALRDFDFSNAQVGLVFSVPGKYMDEDHSLNMLGSRVRSLLPQAHAVKRGALCCQVSRGIKTNPQTSSLGNLTDSFVQEFWSHVYPSLKARPNVKVVFPSTQTVTSSRLGINVTALLSVITDV